MNGDNWTLKKRFSAGDYLILLGRPANSKYSEVYFVEDVTPTHILISLSNGTLISLEKRIDMMGLESVIVKESTQSFRKLGIEGISIKGLPFSRKVEQEKLGLVA